MSESPSLESAIDSTLEEPAVPQGAQAAEDAELELGVERPAAKAQPLGPVVAPVALPASGGPLAGEVVAPALPVVPLAVNEERRAAESVAVPRALPTPPLETSPNRASLLPQVQAMAARTERVKVVEAESANPRALPMPPLEMSARPASPLPQAQAMAVRTERVAGIVETASPNSQAGPDGATTASPRSSTESPLPAGSIAAVVVSTQAPAIRPAMAELPVTMQFPRLREAASPEGSAATPIHVRIGRIEVRAKAPEAPPPQPSRPATVAPLGFARYARQRTYRNWPL